jgi:hypothetical protein
MKTSDNIVHGKSDSERKRQGDSASNNEAGSQNQNREIESGKTRKWIASPETSSLRYLLRRPRLLLQYLRLGMGKD